MPLVASDARAVRIVPPPKTGASGMATLQQMGAARIISLPPRAIIQIYTLDRTLVRMLQKSSDASSLTWDLTDAAG